MGTVRVRGAGHADDPFQVYVTLRPEDLEAARAPESVVLDAPDMAYEADPQVRTVVVQIEDND